MKAKSVKLKLFSPILVKGEAPYENPWDGGEDFRVLVESEKKKCRTEIYDAVSNILDSLSLPASFEHMIYSAVPAVEEKDGRLMLVLNCECFGKLTEAQLDELCGWWENLLSENNDRLSKTQIKTKKLGRIYVHIWFLNSWAVEPIFPARQGG